ncbi:MAG TPA: cobalt-precorrin-6A reductase [Acidimicrobiales bacterium]
MARPRRVLLLGGTSEASGLAHGLADRSDLIAVTSLAGRTSRPRLPPGEVRIGGFGGVAGLVDYLRSSGIDVVVDATHPFARVMRWHAAAACEAVGIGRLRVERPAWEPSPGDRWTQVPSLGAAGALIALGDSRHVMVTTGRSELDAFVPAVDGTRRWLVRCIERPDPLPLHPAEIVLERGPFTFEGDLGLLRDHDVDLLITKNSGGDATVAKLDAARALGVEVIMVRRPPSPPGPVVGSVPAALAWLEAEDPQAGSAG